jgi:hypothetical protein
LWGGWFRCCGVEVLVWLVGQVCVGVCAVGVVPGGCCSYLVSRGYMPWINDGVDSSELCDAGVSPVRSQS